MISKELLSEICQTNLMSLGKLEVVGSDICLYDCSMQPDIYMCWNIYELAHKCKEWAVNLSPNKHALSSYPRWGDIRNYKKTNGSYYICQHLVSGVQFEAETEPEAIFRACEWILEQVGKK